MKTNRKILVIEAALRYTELCSCCIERPGLSCHIGTVLYFYTSVQPRQMTAETTQGILGSVQTLRIQLCSTWYRIISVHV